MRKKANNIIPTSIDGKMQPQAVELEEIVLGAMILENEQLEAVITILKPENFYKPSHQSIYRAITDLFNSSNPVDLRTVPEQCRKNGEYDIAGGHYYISTLTDRVASSANCEYHARIILQKYLARESIRLSTENIQNLYNDETDIEEEIESDISKKTALINNDNSDNNYQIGEVNKAGLILLDKIRCGEVESGIHIGFLGLQRKLGGWHYSDFII